MDREHYGKDVQDEDEASSLKMAVLWSPIYILTKLHISDQMSCQCFGRDV